MMRVEPIAVPSFRATIEAFDRLEKTSDYLVGWHDAFGSGEALGRGLIHRATQLSPGEDPDPRAALSVARQSLPGTFFGVLPKSILWLGLWFFLNDPGMRLVNLLKLIGGRSHAKKPPYLQAHAAFHFLLDYVPNWKFAYKPGGLFQYQVFVPRDHAARVFAKLVTIARDHDHPPYLLVTKRHHPDPFWLTHAVDGFSMAMDFKITRRNRARFEAMAHAMDEIVMDAGGRFYCAKDSVMRPEVFRRVYPAENVRRFLALKARLDPAGLFSTSLFRRVTGTPAV